MARARRAILALLEARGGTAWREPFHVYWRLLYRTARRTGHTEAAAEAATCAVVWALATQDPGLRLSRPPGFLKEWTRRLLLERLAEQALPSPRDATPPPQLCLVPATLWEAEWEWNLGRVAEETVRRQTKPAEFQIHELWLKRGWRLRRIREVLSLPVPRLLLARGRIERALRRELRRLRGRYE